MCFDFHAVIIRFILERILYESTLAFLPKSMYVYDVNLSVSLDLISYINRSRGLTALQIMKHDTVFTHVLPLLSSFVRILSCLCCVFLWHAVRRFLRFCLSEELVVYPLGQLVCLSVASFSRRDLAVICWLS
jgi:hypothetical protein